VLVVILFLQTWRASIIPLVAVPVSIIGTFAVLLGSGFDQRCCPYSVSFWRSYRRGRRDLVVENVERHIATGKVRTSRPNRPWPRSVGRSSPSRLVLCAVFIPVAFVPGLTAILPAVRADHCDFNGHLRVQLTDLVARSCGRVLKPHGAKKDF